MIEPIIEETKEAFLDKSIQILDSLIEEKKNEIKRIRIDAKDKIGVDGKDAGTARSTLYKKLAEIKTANEEELSQYQIDIRYKPSSSSATGHKKEDHKRTQIIRTIIVETSIWDINFNLDLLYTEFRIVFPIEYDNSDFLWIFGLFIIFHVIYGFCNVFILIRLYKFADL